jgi:hypothetical protein
VELPSDKHRLCNYRYLQSKRKIQRDSSILDPLIGLCAHVHGFVKPASIRLTAQRDREGWEALSRSTRERAILSSGRCRPVHLTLLSNTSSPPSVDAWIGEALLRLRADPQLQARIEALADKSTEGQLTPEEREEYEALIRVGQFVSLRQANARRLLAQGNAA